MQWHQLLWSWGLAKTCAKLNITFKAFHITVSNILSENNPSAWQCSLQPPDRHPTTHTGTADEDRGWTITKAGCYSLENIFYFTFVDYCRTKTSKHCSLQTSKAKGSVQLWWDFMAMCAQAAEQEPQGAVPAAENTHTPWMLMRCNMQCAIGWTFPHPFYFLGLTTAVHAGAVRAWEAIRDMHSLF